MAIKYMKKNDYLINTGSERERESWVEGEK